MKTKKPDRVLRTEGQVSGRNWAEAVAKRDQLETIIERIGDKVDRLFSEEEKICATCTPAHVFWIHAYPGEFDNPDAKDFDGFWQEALGTEDLETVDLRSPHFILGFAEAAIQTGRRILEKQFR